MSGSALAYSANGALGDQIIDLYKRINLASYRFLVLVAQFDREHGAAELGFKTTARWLSFYCGIHRVAAREKVRMGRALESLPVIDAAFSRGQVSYSKVRALVRVATPDNEAMLLGIARDATADQAEKVLRQFGQAQPVVDAQSSDASDATDSAARGGDFTCHWDNDGCLVVRGRLAADEGALLLAAMQREMDGAANRMNRANKTNEANPSNQPNPSNPSNPDAPITRAQALADVARTALSAMPSEPGKPVSSADRYQIHVELDQATQHVRGGPGITDRIIEKLSCDASLVTHTHDDQGEPLDVGRKTRTIPPAIRRALTKRDRGCRFPGCTHHRFVDAHHIHHWAHGGETKLSNLVLLCSAHHTAIHERRFRVAAVPQPKSPPELRFYDKNGNHLPPVNDDLRLDNVVDLFPEDAAQHAKNDSAESRHPGRVPSPLEPRHPTTSPDYNHINWILTSYYPPQPPQRPQDHPPD